MKKFSRLLLLLLCFGCAPPTDTDVPAEREQPPPGNRVSTEEPRAEIGASDSKDAPEPETSSEVPAPQRFTFDKEARELARIAGCRQMKITAASMGLGPLGGCIEGAAETAKLFVNGASGSDQVKNVKVMWNDWFQDRGYGLHPDRREAGQLLDAVASRYVPDRKDEIRNAFFNRKTLEVTQGAFKIEITHTRGPAIDEHLLTLTF